MPPKTILHPSRNMSLPAIPRVRESDDKRLAMVSRAPACEHAAGTTRAEEASTPGLISTSAGIELDLDRSLATRLGSAAFPRETPGFARSNGSLRPTFALKSGRALDSTGFDDPSCRGRAGLGPYPGAGPRAAKSLPPVTASVGLTTLSSVPRNGPLLLEAADRAPYRCKRRGRNRITHLDDLPVPASPPAALGPSPASPWSRWAALISAARPQASSAGSPTDGHTLVDNSAT